MTAMESRSCRLCDENSDQMFDIFDTNECSVQIIKMIQDCLPILVYENDPLSKFICNSCNENLNMFYEFKKSCIEIANKHKEDLKETSDENPEVQTYLFKLNEMEQSENADEDTCSNLQNSRMNNTSQSNSIEHDNLSMTDMELEVDEPSTNVPLDKSCNTEFGPAIQHKPRISGPRSQTNLYLTQIKTENIIYHPLTLLELTVQCINFQNIPDFELKYATKEILHAEFMSYHCRYCEKEFEDETELAIHELDTHIHLNLNRVDEGPLWPKDSVGIVRNNWMKTKEIERINDSSADDSMDIDVGDSNDLLIPLNEETLEEENDDPPPMDFSRNSTVYFVGTVAHAMGVPLKNIPKETRNTFYQSAKWGKAKRKFCQLCRFTFKDNWSIDHHYMKAACLYACYYCGMKFKRNKHEMPAHTAAHEKAGHQMSMNVFANEGGGVKEYDTSVLKSYVPQLASIYVKKPPPPPPKPTAMKLRVRQSYSPAEPIQEMSPARHTPPVAKEQSVNKPNNDLANNQAYFCKKCYQVFTRLGNYNIHISTCTGEINDPEMMRIRSYNKKDGSSPVFSTKMNMKHSTNNKNQTKKMPALNPLPTVLTKIKQENGIVSASSLEDFPCHLCHQSFKTIYSRNSHMRVHVKGKRTSPSVPSKGQKRTATPPIVPAKRMKHESFEPIVEIHEGATTTIGSVSITPLRKIAPSGVSPDVLKLVQNNPNITFKPRTPNQAPPNQIHHQKEEVLQQVNTPKGSPPSAEGPKTYKCSACTKFFNNKSKLYFHKKTQCTGSRYPCPFCKKRFGNPAAYSSHIYFSHPE